MVEVTTNRCFVLWCRQKDGKVYFDPTIFTTVAFLVECAEARKEKGEIIDYNYSVVMQPDVAEKEMAHAG